MLLFWSSQILILIKLVKVIVSVPDVLDGYLEWCEEPEIRKRVSLNHECNTLSFVYPFPPCFCLTGGVTVKLEGSEIPRLILGNGGCFNQKSEGTFNRIMKFERSLSQNNYLVAILNQDQSDYTFYEYNGRHKNQVIFTNSPYYVYNGDVIDLLEEYKSIPVLCVQLATDVDKKFTVQNYGLITFSQVYLLLNDTCDGGSALSDSEIISSAPVYSAENSECVPTCPPIEHESILLTKIPVPSSTQDKSLMDPLERNMVKSCKEIPTPLRSLHQDLNRRIMTWAVERCFLGGHQRFALNEFQPTRSFKILEKLVKITERFCREAKIPVGFLHSAVEFFKIAHQGRGFVFAQDFQVMEYKAILKCLSKCLWDMEPLRMKTRGCPQENLWIQSVYRPGSESDNYTIVPTRNHEYFDHHVILDVSWNMIDLANQVCLKSFSNSLRMYHIFEQGMEKLFTADLRNFWLYPETEPLFYDRLFGSTWTIVMRNLEKCIDAAYLFSGNTRQTRLNRPTWISGINTKRGTFVAPICERKRTDVPLISSAYEIYCIIPEKNNSQSSSDTVQSHLDFPPVLNNSTAPSTTDPDESSDTFIDWKDDSGEQTSKDSFLDWTLSPYDTNSPTTTADDDEKTDILLTWPPPPVEKVQAQLTWPKSAYISDNADTHLTWPPPSPHLRVGAYDNSQDGEESLFSDFTLKQKKNSLFIQISDEQEE